MAKSWTKNFENFRGLSYRSSDISRPPNYAKEALNVRISKPYNIRGEPGFKIKAQPKPMFGIHNYIYQDANGQVQEELIGINEILWKLAETYLEITHVGTATAGSYEIAVNETTNVFEFILKEGTTTVLTADLGYGYVAGNMTLQGLANAINAASTEYTAKVLYTCVVNGNQANVGHAASPIAIDASSDMANRSGEWVELITDADGAGTYRYLTDVTGTSISWNHGTELTVTDNQVLGHGQFPAAILPITDGAVAFDTTGGVGSNAARIYYNYWKPISFHSVRAGTPDSTYPIFQTFYDLKTGQTLGYPLSFVTGNQPTAPIPNASFVNAENICFIAAGGAQQLCKYDGNCVYKAGMPKAEAWTVAAGSATGLTGTYYYKFSYIMKDNRGRITEGASTTSSAVTVANQKIDITVRPINPGNLDEINYHEGCAKVNGLQAGVTTITVDADHSLRVGDTAYFANTAIGTIYVERTITAVTNTTITISGSAVTVADNSIISANLRVAIYRTLDAGTDEFFLVAELPHNSIDASFTYTDTTTDANLGAQLIDPEPSTKIPYAPPWPKYITMHQGLLVGAEGFSRVMFGTGSALTYWPEWQPFTNTIAWSDAVAGLEAWPLVNEERISSQTKGQITGIASGAEDDLIVFKEDEIHSITGDLDSNTYRQTQVARGHGVSSHNSIQRISIERVSANTPAGETSKFIVGLGKHGIVFIYGGKVVRELTMEMRGKFYEQNQSEDKDWYAYEMAESCFNPLDYEYKVSMPTVNPNFDTYSSSNLFRFDTEEGAWFRSNHDYTFSGGVLNQTGGMAVHQDQTYFVSHYDSYVNGACKSALFAYHSPSIGNKAYAANTFPILQDFIPQWDFIGEPSIKKDWHQLVYYTLQNSEEFIPFSVRIRTYRNWEDPFTATASTDYTLTFTSASEVEKFFDLKRSTNAKSMLFRFTVSAIHTCLNLTGYEYSATMGLIGQVKK